MNPVRLYQISANNMDELFFTATNNERHSERGV